MLWNVSGFIDCLIFIYLFGFFGSFSKLVWLLIKVTTGHQNLSKIDQNSKISYFLPEGQKKPQPRPRKGTSVSCDTADSNKNEYCDPWND